MVMRLGGLATGIDTDTIVKQMLAREQAKIDKVGAQKQVLQWQQETYRDFAGSIRGFKDKYFDVLNKGTYALSSNFFTNMSANIIGTDKGLLNIKANNTAKTGRYEVKIEQQAKGAILQTDKITEKKLVGKELEIQTGDMESPVTIKSVKNIKELVEAINSNDALKGKVTANYSEISGKFTLETVETGGSKLLEVGGTMASELGFSTGDNYAVASTVVPIKQPNITTGPIKINGTNNLATLNTQLSQIGISSGKITIGTDDVQLSGTDTIKDLIDKIQSKIPDSTVEIDGEGKISITGKSGTTFSIGGDAEVLKNLGLSEDGSTTPSIEIVTDINYKMDIVKNTTDSTTKININGREVTIDFNGDFSANPNGIPLKDSKGNVLEGITLQKDATGNYSIYSTVDFNVSGKKDELDKIGVSVPVPAPGDPRKFSSSGQDAIIQVKTPGEKDYLTVINSKNNFTLDGINFDLKGVNDNINDSIVFNLETNTDKAVENVKELVKAYNELIDSIASKIYEKKQYKYAPLTDEQKKSMKEDEIKVWEEKCKQGILRNDPALDQFLTNLRGAFFEKVEGVDMSLKELGIDTSVDFTQRGKLSINEEKLRKALSEKPDEVADFFTKSNPSAPYDKDKGYLGNKERKDSVGVFNRISDIIEDAIRTTRNTDGKKGSLLEKAGIKGDSSDIKNNITDKIKDKDNLLYELAKKMQSKENELYKKFAYLEKMTNFYQSQTNWLNQQLGGM